MSMCMWLGVIVGEYTLFHTWHRMCALLNRCISPQIRRSPVPRTVFPMWPPTDLHVPQCMYVGTHTSSLIPDCFACVDFTSGTHDSLLTAERLSSSKCAPREAVD